MSTHHRKKKQSARINIVISVIFHAIVVGGLVFLAAREGMLGTQLKTLAVQMAPKEKKKPEKKPEEKKEEKKPEPKVEEAKAKTPEPKIVEAPRVPPPSMKVPTVEAPPVAAPPPAEVGGFNFTDASAKNVQSTSDPVTLYKNYMEYMLRTKWRRPENIADANFVAEVNVSIDQAGRITSFDLKKGSGDDRWDNSVRSAIKQTVALNRPPPKNFPPTVLVRFDTVEETESLSMLSPQ